MNRFLTSKEKFYEFLESGWTGRKDDEANKVESPEEPEQKKIKLDNDGNNKEKKKMRGQNKSRPHMKPQSYEDRRLCTSIIQVMTQTHLFNVFLSVLTWNRYCSRVLQERETKCVFGEKCRFIHDVSEYMAGKPEDLGDQCYLYNTFGKCHYGLTCRFAKAHISPDLKNVVNEDLHKHFTDKETVRNNLDKELQRRLRKKQFPFTGAEAYLKTIIRGKKPEKKSTDECSEENHSCTDAPDAPDVEKTQQVTTRSTRVRNIKSRQSNTEDVCV